MARYVALIRGINVGGNHLIKMAELKDCFEELGLRDVQTYIQSGNVLFTSTAAPARLCTRIETAIETAFRCRTSVVIRSAAQMRTIVERAPRGFGTDPRKYRYDVLFLKEPLTAKAALEQVPTQDGVDDVRAGRGVLYFSRLVSKASQSRLSRLVSLPVYKRLTIRNWNTTTQLSTLSSESPYGR